MEADSKWLAANEAHWQQQTTTATTTTAGAAAKNTNNTNRFDSLNSTTSTKSGSSSLNELNSSSQHNNHSGTATSSSVYEDADCGGGGTGSALSGGIKDQHLTVGSLHRSEGGGSSSQNHSTQSLNNNLYSKFRVLSVCC